MNAPDTEAARQRLLDLLDPQLPAVLRVFAELGIADLVAGGTTTVSGLAAATDCDPDRLARLLLRLAAAELLSVQGGTVALSPEAELLRRDHPASVAPYAPAREVLESWSRLRDGLRPGAAPPHELAHGVSFFDLLQTRPVQAAGFDRAMSRRAQAAGRSIADLVQLPEGATVVDVGGGDGTLVRSLLDGRPDLQAVVFDQPDAVERARVQWQDVPAVTLVGGDFFAAVPHGGDVYVLSHILHDWEDPESLQVLRVVGEAMSTTATLLLVETAAPDDVTGAEAVAAAELDIDMLVVTGGKERTRSQWAQLLEEAGFVLEGVTATDGPWSLLEARLR